MALDFDLVIPSRDGLPHVFVIAREYARLKLTPRYFIDARSAPLFRSAAPRLLEHATLLSSSGVSIEEMLPEIVAQTRAAWVWRMDDDEAPSTALLAWLAQLTPDDVVRVVAMPRRAVRFEDGVPVYARSIPKLTEHDYQYRAFVRSGVTFDPTLHTAGIAFAPPQVIHAPPDYCLYHFDWIVRTRAQRADKLLRYERLKPGSWDAFDCQYLPEDFAGNLYDYAAVEDADIVRLARRLRLARRVAAAMSGRKRPSPAAGSAWKKPRLFDRRPAGLFVTHVVNDRITAHFERLQRESAAFVSWQFVLNRATVQDLAEQPSRGLRRMGRHRLSEALRHGRLQMGYMDVLLVPLALQTNRRFAWICEYDVDFSGDWADVFRQFARDRTDLLATTLNPEARDPAWAFWPGAVHPASVPETLRTRSFLPLFRVSRRLLDAYCRAVSTGDWRGHYEFLFPTIARAAGLTLEDIGGDGPFTAPPRYGTNYANTPDHPHLTPGTFVWRPSRDGYFHENPAAFDRRDMLYHPVKPGIADWRAGP